MTNYEKIDNFQKNLITADADLQEAIKTFNFARIKIGLIVDEANVLLGTITDGDVRRSLSSGASLTERAIDYANRNPKTLFDENEISLEQLLELKDRGFFCIPVLNQKNQVTSLIDLVSPNTPIRKETVFIMAGGLGTRLGALTKNTPKPMLSVLNKPVLEHIIESFKSNGFQNFIIALQHEHNQFTDYFGHGEKMGVKINYTIEKEKLGTAGALSLLDQDTDGPLIITNADVVTNFDFNVLLKTHVEDKNQITVATWHHEVAIPYGVVESTGNGKIHINEKPTMAFPISTGINVINREMIEAIPPNQYVDMPDFISSSIDSGSKVGTCAMHGYWIDVGVRQDFEQLNSDLRSNILW